MHAECGDKIVIEISTLAAPRRRGVVVEVIGQGEHEHYRMRWEDGHESVYFPGPDAHMLPGELRPAPVVVAASGGSRP